MAVSADKITNVANKLKAWFEAKSNKTNDLSTDYSNDTDSYPTSGAVQSYVTGEIADKADASDIPTKTSDLTNDSNFVSSGSLHTVATSGSYEDLTNKPTIPTATSDLTNDSGFITQHQDISGKANSADLATVATSGDYDDLINKPTIPGAVTVEKQAQAESGYASTYVVKQGGSQVGSKINIPKDFFVKSAQVKTAAAADLTTLGQGYSEGDKYIDFVINTIDNDETNAHMYVNVKDLVEDTTYTADESTLTLVSGQFKVKNGGIGATQLASEINTKLGYAEAYNSNTVLQGITATDISNWNAKSELTMAQVDSEINAALDALANEFTSN